VIDRGEARRRASDEYAGTIRRDPSRRRAVVASERASFQLVTTDGVALGARELGESDWPLGSVIYTDPAEPNLRVEDMLATENDDLEMHFKASSSKRSPSRAAATRARTLRCEDSRDRGV